MNRLNQPKPNFNITFPNVSLPELLVSSLSEATRTKSARRLERCRKRSAHVARLASLYREWAEHEAVEIASSLRQQAWRLDQCCGYWQAELRQSGKRSARPGGFCHVRFCPNCAARRSARFAAKFAPHIRAAERQGHRVRFLTLTVPNVPLDGLRKGIKELFAAWSKLRRQKLFAGVVGSLAALDLTINETTGEGHHHLHIIIIGGAYIPQSDIADAWSALAGGCMVDIRDTDEKRLKELLKYQIKVSEIQDWQQLEQLSSALAGINCIRATGCLRGLNNIELDEDDEDIELDENDEADPVVEVFGYFAAGDSMLDAWLDGSISVEEMRARSRLRVT